MQKYPTLEKFMLLNNLTNKEKAEKLLEKIKDNHKKGKYFAFKIS